MRTLTNINYPLEAPSNLIYETTVTAPSGFNIRIALPVGELNQECGESYLEVRKDQSLNHSPESSWSKQIFNSLTPSEIELVLGKEESQRSFKCPNESLGVDTK